MPTQSLNINTFARFLFYFFCFLFLVSCERVVGLPLFAVTFAGIWLSSLPLFSKLPVLVFLSFVLAVFYVVPMTVVMVLLFFVHMNLELSEKIIVDQSVRFFLTILVACGVLAVLTHTHFGWLAWSYHVLAATSLMLFIRYWLYRKNSTHILHISQRLRTR